MSNVTFTSIDGVTYPLSLPYCECSTIASQAAKTGTLAGFALESGAMVTVKFTNENSASNPTLNINGTGAKSIKAYGTTAPTVFWKAGSVIEFVYDGTNYIMANFGAIKLGTITNNTSGGTSQGTINAGQQIKIGKGFYAADSYYQAASGSGTNWIPSSGGGTFTKDGSPGNPSDQSLRIWMAGTGGMFLSTYGYMNGLKSGSIPDYYTSGGDANTMFGPVQFASCSQSSPMKVLITLNTSCYGLMIGTTNYDPSYGTYTNSFYLEDWSSFNNGMYLFEFWPNNNLGSIHYRYQLISG